MDLLRDDSEHRTVAQIRAAHDAMAMQDAAVKECTAAGKEAPAYVLSELIGKGTFGRVYKASGPHPGTTVAVKIMSIEEGDSMAPRENDTFGEILKEVSTVKELKERGAKNINAVIDTLLIGQSMWMVTEYCGGGSVATLMRPTGSLSETWIVPILRGVAEALYWVHKQGVIHRDIKCANVLITDEGGVQLCDFGVAGTIKSRFEKRTTITGTLQWMAPELFDSNVTYGNEIDIWAFGSMAYELATGLPPNATAMLDTVDLESFGAYLRECSPRLDGDCYSSQLKDLVDYCMVPDPSQRPRIADVRRHPYISDTAEEYPTGSLASLVSLYKEWERQGGTRASLFSTGGARGPAQPDRPCAILKEGWDYGTMVEADQLAFESSDIVLELGVAAHLAREGRRRVRQQTSTSLIKPPLEKVFDPNTVANYSDHVRSFYSNEQPAVESGSSSHGTPMDGETIRESPLRPTPPAAEKHDYFAERGTVKPSCLSRTSSLGKGAFGTSRTRDWTFPAMAHMQSAFAPEAVVSPFSQADDPMLKINLGRPCYEFKPKGLGMTGSSRLSRVSLIDLDAGLPPSPDMSTLPLVSPGRLGSSTDEQAFQLRVDYAISTPPDNDSPTSGSDDENSRCREPSLYIPFHLYDGSSRRQSQDRRNMVQAGSSLLGQWPSTAGFHSCPPLPTPPTTETVLGHGNREGLKDEWQRLFISLGDHLQYASDKVEHVQVKQ
ncbi:serine/threonine protein kinase [Cercophora scortea]|uniref:non-specific serine/threonine protein kinase n=1 Tax=Cercophora scortea TaxID=314031 RepID=A0AAE0IDQ5_9PEZI|nr:serine/threonine protein kinase [Cercophora scortea]